MGIIRMLMLASGLTLPVWATAADAQRIVTQGAAGTQACATCHGKDGAGQAQSGFPRLAGLNVAYLEKQLRDFKTGRRDNPVMAPVAKGLNEAQIKAVARYFAAQRPPTPKVDVDPDTARRGEKLARSGEWDKDIPACFRCHGENGAGVPPHFPPIAGQHRRYLEAQLTAWKQGRRGNDPLDLMQTIAGRMSADEIEAVAAYLSTHPADSTHTGLAER